ncbi:MAG TPA: 2-hydroxychromene-2-carboxylate isomerase [Terriglobia bacterium]|nr:2-hydroxychromene-2-carboxylate isomerase [Terriglobia bacterium]
MAGIIEFWFDFSSPYGYFGALQIEALAAKHERRLLWRPYLLGVAFKTTGMQPLLHMPLRGDYARHDWTRTARHAGIPFTLPASFPTATVAAARAAYWLERERPDLLGRFVLAVYRAYFSEGREIHAPAGVVEIAGGIGADRPQLQAAMASPALKDRLRIINEEAVSRGIFGSPFIIADGEPFWGADRLPMVDEWLQRGGW